MEQLTLVTDEAEYAPVSSEPTPELTTVECPICHEVIEVPEYDAVSRSDALREHLKEKHTSSSQGSEFHELMLHAVGDMFGPGGIVIDEERAKATSCECVEYKPDKFWCTSKGVVGALTDEQERIYCNPRIMVEKPALKERLKGFAEAVEVCKAEMPPTDGRTRLEVYLKCMSRELKTKEIKA
ncbi:unnamed protein product [marine sediment metagenome]|uniref:Uncharacterized protein n=1 Tax=marine sediment metagenome TaxID=412755 RepID=X1MPJ8_9ZZZZ